MWIGADVVPFSCYNDEAGNRVDRMDLLLILWEGNENGECVIYLHAGLGTVGCYAGPPPSGNDVPWP